MTFDRSEHDQRILARAFSADARPLTDGERLRLEQILDAGSVRAGAPSSPGEQQTEPHVAEQGEAQPRVSSSFLGSHRRSVLASAGAAVAVGSFLIGMAVSPSNSASPYLSAEQVLTKTGQNVTMPLKVVRPAGNYDAESLFLSTIIDDNAVWIGTRSAGAETCFYVDLGVPAVHVEGCAPSDGPVSGISVTPNDPRLEAEDKGQYTLNIYEGALPFVTFSRET